MKVEQWKKRRYFVTFPRSVYFENGDNRAAVNVGKSRVARQDSLLASAVRTVCKCSLNDVGLL